MHPSAKGRYHDNQSENFCRRKSPHSCDERRSGAPATKALHGGRAEIRRSAADGVLGGRLWRTWQTTRHEEPDHRSAAIFALSAVSPPICLDGVLVSRSVEPIIGIHHRWRLSGGRGRRRGDARGRRRASLAARCAPPSARSAEPLSPSRTGTYMFGAALPRDDSPRASRLPSCAGPPAQRAGIKLPQCPQNH